MKNKTYQNAVDHLEFSDDLYERVLKNAPEPKRPVRILAALATAVLATVLLVSTVMAVGSHFQKAPAKIEHTVPVVTLGTAKEEITDAKMLELTVSKMTEGVTVHYMELDPVMQYSYIHGMLYAWRSGYQRITEDYEFEQVEMKTVDMYLDKNGVTYKARFAYLDTEEGVISKHKNIYQKDENGEILLNLFHAPNYNWPVYLNVETGEYRDALPDWSAEDFGTMVVYTQSLKGGLFLSTLVESEKDSYNEYFWIGPDATEAKRLNIPERALDTIFNDTLYYQNAKGHLYVMDDSFNFQLMAEYETEDNLTDGLMTVVTDEGKLGVFDVLTGETYVFPDLNANEVYVDKTSGMDAIRYGKDGRIALVELQVNWDELRQELVRLGVLDLERGELHLLEISYDLQIYGAHWLDANRLGVIYKTEDRQFFCIYEFE